MRKYFLLVAALVLVVTSVWAQRTITGRVTDDKGNPMSDVSVLIKGTAIGTTTKADGSFSIQVTADGAVLVISSVDMATQEIAVGDDNNFSITLQPASKIMNEVVVVAYGTQKRESITGSVSKIGAADLEGRLTTNITQALAGAAPGIAATSGNGQPGSSAAIRIRGIGSINANSSPLYVVDGFPFEGDISDINTNDIESISL
ncbi:MAG TPA: TonB-dependent receptor plug domain-containing protein, partial [Chitinophagaceae bacterium]|nr:TonB-dependent receptor plug domain-containing protein [Chitinophagaceae bacterium]